MLNETPFRGAGPSSRRRRERERRLRVVFGLAASLTVGCGGEDAGISVEPAEQSPSRSVQLNGLPEGLEEPTIRFRALEAEWSDWSAEVRAERDEGGALVMRVPVHPAGLAVGGSLELTVVGVDGATSRLDVEAVPAAPGTTRRYVASLARMARQMIESWGVSSEEVLRTYRDDPSELPPQLLSAAVAVDLLDGPDNRNAVLRVIDGSAPILAGERLDLDAADRLLALWVEPDRVSALPEARPVRFASLLPIPRSFGSGDRGGSNPPLVARAHRAALPTFPAARAAPAGAQDVGLPAPRSGKVSIHTAEALDHWMRKRAALEEEYGGLKQQVRMDIGNLLDLVPHGAAALLVISNNAFDYALRSNLGLLPSQLDQLVVQAQPTEFLEDDISVGNWKASVVARSGTLQFTYFDLVEATAGAWDIAKFGTGTVRALRGAVSEESVAFKVGDYAGQRLADKTKDWKKDKTDVLGPYEWGPIDISDKEWTTARISSQAAAKPCAVVTNLQRSYMANAAGACRLVVEMRTEAGKFGGVSSWGDAALFVQTIDVDVTPNGETVKPGRKITFTATVRNANRQDVAWEASGGSGAPGSGNAYEWTAPELEGGRCRDMVTIAAESMTRRGPRESGEPPRIGRATVRVEDPLELEIVPDDVVLAPGEPFEFDYRAEGSAEVRWTAETPGKIDGRSGAYRAPTEEGSYGVQAAIIGGDGNSCAEDEASVRVAGCSWLVTFDGKAFRSEEGDEASFLFMPGGFSFNLARANGQHVGGGRTPKYGDRVMGNMGASIHETYGSYEAYKEPKLPMSITLFKSSSGVAAGTASGQVRVINPMTEEVRLAPFRAEFVIVGKRDEPEAPAANPMDYLDNMDQMLGRMPMLPPGTITPEQQAQLEEALRSAMSPEEAARQAFGMEELKEGRATIGQMLGGLAALSCKVPKGSK